VSRMRRLGTAKKKLSLVPWGERESTLRTWRECEVDIQNDLNRNGV